MKCDGLCVTSMCVFLKENLCSQKTCEQGFNKHKALWKEWGGVWGGEGKVWGSPFLQKSFPSLPQCFYTLVSYNFTSLMGMPRASATPLP